MHDSDEEDFSKIVKDSGKGIFRTKFNKWHQVQEKPLHLHASKFSSHGDLG